MSLGQPRRQAGRQGSSPRYRVATRRRIPPASRPPASLPRPAAMAGRRWAGRCAALAVLLAAWSLPRGGSAGRLFLNEWAAEIPAGPDAARAIADELDYDLVGQVRPGGGLRASRRALRDGAPFPSREAPSLPSPSNLCPAAARWAPGSLELPVPHRSLPGLGSAPGALPGTALSEGTGQGDSALLRRTRRRPPALLDGSGRVAPVLLGGSGQGRAGASALPGGVQAGHLGLAEETGHSQAGHPALP